MKVIHFETPEGEKIGRWETGSGILQEMRLGDRIQVSGKRCQVAGHREAGPHENGFHAFVLVNLLDSGG
jgi:hypothetical protein